MQAKCGQLTWRVKHTDALAIADKLQHIFTAGDNLNNEPEMQQGLRDQVHGKILQTWELR